MHHDGGTWVLLLAAGEGSRLRTLTTTGIGASVPKQFCSLQGGPSLLHAALDRAQALTRTKNIFAIVAAQHARWWRTQLKGLPSKNVIVQPHDRGTANGILLPLLRLQERAPRARIVILPSDHHVRGEAVLEQSIREGLDALRRGPHVSVLLGLTPEDADSQQGYIVPGDEDDWRRRRVAQFIEKPTTAQARELMSRGALWNAFIMVSSVEALLALFSQHVPEVLKVMQAVVRLDGESGGAEGAIAKLYQELPMLDFSRDILEKQSSSLRVQPVPPCGWSDLGIPERVAHARHRAPGRADVGL